MHSFIIVSKEVNKRRDYVETFCKEKGIGKFDQKIFTSEDASFGVALVRDLQHAAFLKPSRSEEKALILEDAQKVTTEAQNALLKLLEEPPAHTYVFLSCTTDAYFLPTILSRCKVIVLLDKKTDLSETDVVQYTSILDSLLSDGISEKLYLAEKIAGDKEELSTWFTNMILFLRDKMILDPENRMYPRVLINMQEAHKLFQTTNVAPRAILEHFFLSF